MKKRTLFDAGKTPLLIKEYEYDERGNPIEEKTSGDLTGMGNFDVYSKFLSYTSHDQICFENDGIKQIYSTYYPKSDHLKTRYIKKNDKILVRNYFEYAGCGTVNLEIKDDGSNEDINNLSGVSERHIKRISYTRQEPKGLPEVIEEKYLDLETEDEVLLKRTVITYSHSGRPVRHDVYGSDYQLAYSLEWKYDSMGNVLWEKNAIGEISKYKYDANRNKIYSKTSDNDYYTTYTYDYSNRLINESQIFDNGTVLSKQFTYDLRGNKITFTDIYGNTTRYQYDEFNRLEKTTHPEAKSIETIGYDEFNNVILKEDGNGHITRMTYNALGKPTLIVHPCGAVESHLYTLRGNLKQSVLPNGSYILYKYDFKDRLILKQTFDSNRIFVSKNTWVYNAFHLLQERDGSGNITKYTYDHAGRLIKTIKGDAESRYVYDTLGRKHETWEKYSHGYYRKTINLYDFLDRVLEERIEDTLGKVFSHLNYTYDENGNITSKSMKSSEAIIQEIYEYDCYDQLLKIIHPNREATRFFRDYNYHNSRGNCVKYEEEIDALGNSTISIYDEKGDLEAEQYKSPYGNLMRRVTHQYDGAGNLVNRFEDQLDEDKKPIETRFEYDERNQEITIIEAVGTPDCKITRKEYNCLGKISRIVKPDGAEIAFLYNALGRLIDEIDSAGGFHHQYEYDSNDNIISVSNLITKVITCREYDVNDRVVREILDNGIELKYYYDNLGRTRKLILPDRSSISCEYDARNLVKLSRDTGKRHYHYQYTYDLSGKIKKVALPFLIGEASYSYDYALRLTDICTPYFSQNIPVDGYDSCNRLVKYRSEDAVGTLVHNYAYDALDQLIAENGVVHHTYNYDSRFNRTKMDDVIYENNVLNQLLSQGPVIYRYDQNGNRNSVLRSAKNQDCKFDTLDRLVEVVEGKTKVKFEYDAFHRRMTKQVLESIDGIWKETLFEKYIYATDTEIGAMDRHGKIKELKIMVPGSLKNSAAFEFDSKIYVPIHDHRGNVVSILTEVGNIIETYRYSAYGVEEIFDYAGVKTTDSINPWRFSGKRIDSETGLGYFGRRYYDPEIGKWIGPDPIWFEDGTNLYAYVQNSPIVYIDPNGLWTEGFESFCSGAAECGRTSMELLCHGSGLCYGAIDGMMDPIGAYSKNSMEMPSEIWEDMDRYDRAHYIGATNGRYLGMGIVVVSLVRATVSAAAYYGGAQAAEAGISLLRAPAAAGAQTLETSAGICANRSLTIYEGSNVKNAVSTRSLPKNVFPENPKDLLPQLPRDHKGRIYTADNIRIRPEKHAFETADVYNPRHHEQHYHVEYRAHPLEPWKKTNIRKCKPENYNLGDGTGFLPGERFPGA